MAVMRSPLRRAETPRRPRSAAILRNSGSFRDARSCAAVLSVSLTDILSLLDQVHSWDPPSPTSGKLGRVHWKPMCIFLICSPSCQGANAPCRGNKHEASSGYLKGNPPCSQYAGAEEFKKRLWAMYNDGTCHWARLHRIGKIFPLSYQSKAIIAHSLRGEYLDTATVEACFPR